MPVLENWCITYNPYIAPESRVPKLGGNVFGHSMFEDGERVRTSAIVGKKGNIVLTRSGTEYTLGNVSEEYENEFPNALQRLLDNLKEIV